MKLISLGLSSIPRPAPAPAAGPDLAEYGATGTSIWGGFLRDSGEYNPSLAGTAAFGIYEKMRRSDAQVAATLAAMKLPIRGAEWTVQEPDEATPVEEEAAEFVRECLLEEIDFDAVLANALLSLDFGCALHEDVYYVDGNRVRLRKLAPRLPSTFYRWITAEGTQDLVAIEQLGELPGGSWGTATVPMAKAALFTQDGEGAHWAGRSVMRAMYQHWWIKSNLYKIDAIAHERNGMGIPFVELAPSASKEDRALAHQFVQQICAHERAGVVLPNGAKFSLVGVQGQVRDASATIAHHNTMISMAGLAMFLQLGQSESGNRALGQTMSDFFQMSLEATAWRIARTLKLTTVARLVEYNFGPDVRPPDVVPAQILAVKLDSVVDALQKLAGGGFIGSDEELEKWLRGRMGLPDAPGEKRPGRRAAAGQEAPAEGSEGSDAGQAGQADIGALNAKSGKTRGAQALSEAAGLKLRRAPGTVGSEMARRAERCLALSEIAGELDRGRDAIAAALRAARPAVQAEAVQRLMSVRVRDMHRVAVPLPEKLVAQVEEILRGVYAFGAGQVEAERARQAAGAEPSGAAEVRLATVPRKPKREPLGVYADGVVAEFVNGLVSRAVTVALDWVRRPGDLTRGEVIQRVSGELDEQSDKWIDGAASKGANEAFADGRADGYEEHAEEIGSVIYSALLDINTCPNCAAADGAEGRTPADIPAVPNPDCDGGDRCRCVHVYVFSDEVRK